MDRCQRFVVSEYESVGFKAFGCEPGAICIDGELQDEIHMYLRLTNS